MYVLERKRNENCFSYLKYHNSFVHYNIFRNNLFQNKMIKKSNSLIRLSKPKMNYKVSFKDIVFNSNKVKIRKKIHRDELCQYSQELSSLTSKNIELIKLKKLKYSFDKSDNNTINYPLIKDDYYERKRLLIDQNNEKYKSNLNTSVLGIIGRLKKNGLFNKEYIKSLLK